MPYLGIRFQLFFSQPKKCGLVFPASGIPCRVLNNDVLCCAVIFNRIEGVFREGSKLFPGRGVSPPLQWRSCSDASAHETSNYRTSNAD